MSQRVRVIPVLLIQNKGLVKSVQFKKHKYVGDPINAVKIFNDKEVDEIAIIDISASINNSNPNIDYIKEIAGEAFMPLSYGGGISTIDQIKSILYNGAEKVIIQSNALTNPELISEAASQFGSQSIVVCIDVKKNWRGKKVVVTKNAKVKASITPIKLAQKVEELGAGEIIVQSVNNDGMFCGYDLSLINDISKNVGIPVMALGGASSLENMKDAIDSGASSVAAGSFFVFQLPHRAVLISYPGRKELLGVGLG